MVWLVMVWLVMVWLALARLVLGLVEFAEVLSEFWAGIAQAGFVEHAY
jgi:hypothetical protein